MNLLHQRFKQEFDLNPDTSITSEPMLKLVQYLNRINGIERCENIIDYTMLKLIELTYCDDVKHKGVVYKKVREVFE